MLPYTVTVTRSGTGQPAGTDSDEGRETNLSAAVEDAAMAAEEAMDELICALSDALMEAMSEESCVEGGATGVLGPMMMLPGVVEEGGEAVM